MGTFYKALSHKTNRLTVFCLLILFSFTKGWGQASLPLSRTTWGGAEPAGWTNSGCSQRTSTFACTGSDATTFDTNGDSRTVLFNSAPDQLIFKLKKSSMSGESSLLVQESSDGTTWSSVGIYGTATGATAITDCGNITITLNCLSRYVKWTYTKATGNCDMDDVSISSFSGSCGSCTTPTITLSSPSQTLCPNNTGTICVSSTASSPSYSWEMSSDGSTWVSVGSGTPTGVSYGGTTSASLTATGTSSLSQYYYHCIVTDGTCTATSSTHSLSIYPVTTTTLAPSSNTVCMNTNASYTVGTSASSPTYQWQMSSATGGPWVNVANGTPAGVSYTGATTNSLTTNGTQTVSAYYYRCLVTDPLTGCTATTTTGTLKIGINFTSQPYNAVITSAQTATFVSNITGGGTSYQWQVNSGAGFSNVVNGGVYSGATTSMLTVANPPTSMNSYSYQCIITNTCTSVTSTAAILYVSAPTSTSCPRMTGVFVNACNGSCGEGDNEILFLNSGSYNIPVSPANIAISYGSVSTPSVNYTGSFTTNAAITASLNALSNASCTTLFVDASTVGTIPANSVFMIVRNTACYAFDFSSYCPASTVYVLYSTDTDWTSTGNFTNGGSVGVLRYFVADFTGVAGGCSTTYNYQPNLLTLGADGDAISFQNGGGAATNYFNGGCTPPPLVLPIQLLDFYGTKNGNINEVSWKVAEEKGIQYYTIEKSKDGVNFEELNVISLNESYENIKNYSIIDNTPYKEVTYYRLSTREIDGNVKRHKIISIEEKVSGWDYNYYQQQEHLVVEFKNTVPKNSIMSLYDLSGKLLAEDEIKLSQTKINTSNFATGIYFVKISSPYKTENFKVIIQK